MTRTSSRALPDGSSTSQSVYLVPGKTGQVSPHPIVTTKSTDLIIVSDQRRGTAPAMSIPTSAIASTAIGFTVSTGSDPAENTSTDSPPRDLRKPAAIWDRPALWTQRKRTPGFIASTIEGSGERTVTVMWRRSEHGSRVVGLACAVVALAACGIAETKLPPEPTVEYLPCSAIDLSGAEPAEPFTVLLDLIPELESSWGGAWQAGDDPHIGLTDVGAIDWQAACPQIGDPALVVHEVPFPLADLMIWSELVADRVNDGESPGAASSELVVNAGQYVIEIRADTVEDAALLAGDVPLDAWAYGGPASSESG